jgi:hypothetical protein
LNELASHATVSGVVIHLDQFPPVAAAYAEWDRHPMNPNAANYMAASIKSLLYQLAARYKNLKHLVIVGPDQAIPFRRIVDEANVSNERKYNSLTVGNSLIARTLSHRQILSDDYYGALLPLPYRNRELYLPQLGVGRLVERPADIVAQINAFLNQPTINVASALVTGYDFTVDEATIISQTLALNGVTRTLLINDNWTANDARAAFFGATGQSEQSLNGHYDHWRMQPASGSNYVTATEVASATTNFANSLIFSIGCHAGLNILDADATTPAYALDWAQAYASKGATYIGNTGYGYGDTDLVAYSEQLAVNFAQAINQAGQTTTVGEAMKQAKQTYFNKLGYSAFSNYDEKVLGEWTLYGLTMRRIALPSSRIVAREPEVAQTVSPARVHANGLISVSRSVSPTLTLNTETNGRYYSVNGETHTLAGRPIEPRLSIDIGYTQTSAYTLTHGVLVIGGRTRDEGIDPVVSQIVTDAVYLNDEPAFDNSTTGFYPDRIATINRLLRTDGRALERIVLLPGQFFATANVTETIGTQRVWERLDLVTFHASFAITDFVQPTLSDIEAVTTTNSVTFTSIVSDSSGILRVVVLYRNVGSAEWNALDLAQQGVSETWTGQITGRDGVIEYFVQAVDNAGNVAWLTDYGNPFTIGASTTATQQKVYLPLVVR